MGSNFGVLQLIWAVLGPLEEGSRSIGRGVLYEWYVWQVMLRWILTLSSATNLGCPKSIRRGVLYEWYVWQVMVQVHPCCSF